MKDKTIRFLLTIVVSMIGLSASAYDFEVDGVFYSKYTIAHPDYANSVYVTYKGEPYSHSDTYAGIIVIPDIVTYEGTTYKVKEIGVNTFYGCTDLTTITIGNNVTGIGVSAFEGCI